MGQSAGAHLAALCIIDAAEKEAALEKLCASQGMPEQMQVEGWWRTMEPGFASSLERMAFSCRQLTRYVRGAARRGEVTAAWR
eukprot:749475-Hanusia_phi.AAC.2